MSSGLTLGTVMVCLMIQGFFSGSEIALLSSRKIRLRRKRHQGSRGAALALHMISKSQWYLATTSTGTNMAVVVSSVVSALWFERLLGPYGEIGTILVLPPVLLTLGEILPRTICQYKATELAPKMAPVLLVFSYILAPVTSVVYGISFLFSPGNPKEPYRKRSLASREELELILNIPVKGSDVRKTEKKLIRQIFEFSKTEAGETMVPLIELSALPDTATVGEAADLVCRTGHSRIPVFKDQIHNLTGVVRAFDILSVTDPQSPIAPFIREVPYVPEMNKLEDLLLFLQKQRKSMAIVVDEYGGTTGIITVKDILKEVVGDIRDENDPENRDVIRLGKNRFRVNARTDIDILNDQLRLDLPKDGYETLGGFILKQMGRIPSPGEFFTWGDVTVRTTRASKRSVNEAVITLHRQNRP